MLRNLPPLNALKAFEAAARHESFTRAAEELCVTQGAVSHQVKALESELGLKLFLRETQGLALTDLGREYLGIVRDAFDRIALGTQRVVQCQTSGVLTVSTSPDFAAKWLVNRLGKFADLHTEIELRISAAMHRVDFSREDVDMAVRHGNGSWDELDAVRLCPERLFPVCSSKLLAGRKRRLKPVDVMKLPLLHLDSHEGWTRWLAAAEVVPVKPLSGLVLNRASMVIDAAIDGQGIALARSALAAWDLLGNRLMAPFPFGLPLKNVYWIVAPRATSALPKISAFRNWLLAEAAADTKRVAELLGEAA